MRDLDLVTLNLLVLLLCHGYLELTELLLTLSFLLHFIKVGLAKYLVIMLQLKLDLRLALALLQLLFHFGVVQAPLFDLMYLS